MTLPPARQNLISRHPGWRAVGWRLGAQRLLKARQRSRTQNWNGPLGIARPSRLPSATGLAWPDGWLSTRRARRSIRTGRTLLIDAQFDPTIELEQLIAGEEAAVDPGEGLALAHWEKLELAGIPARPQELRHGCQPRRRQLHIEPGRAPLIGVAGQRDRSRLSQQHVLQQQLGRLRPSSVKLASRKANLMGMGMVRGSPCARAAVRNARSCPPPLAEVSESGAGAAAS